MMHAAFSNKVWPVKEGRHALTCSYPPPTGRRLLSVESGLLPCPDALKAAEENKENGTYIMMLPIAESKQ